MMLLYNFKRAFYVREKGLKQKKLFVLQAERKNHHRAVEVSNLSQIF